MKVAIMQPRFFPWLGDLDKMKRVDLVIWMDDVQFDSREYVHRCRLLSNGKPVWMTVPVAAGGRHRGTLIREVKLGRPTYDWRQRHLEQLRQYHRGGGYNDVIYDLKAIYDGPAALEVDELLAWNLAAIDLLGHRFGIATPWVVSSRQYGDCPAQKSDRILWLCQQAGATEYLSGALGRDYLKLGDFEREGIAVQFHQFEHPTYRQGLQPDFQPGLSALDALLNLGREAAELLKG